jgi:lactoylglutathione lyase
MPAAKKARAVGLHHIALEVGDIDEALSFYGRWEKAPSGNVCYGSSADILTS